MLYSSSARRDQNNKDKECEPVYAWTRMGIARVVNPNSYRHGPSFFKLKDSSKFICFDCTFAEIKATKAAGPAPPYGTDEEYRTAMGHLEDGKVRGRVTR
jgi:hypothetical protein